MGFVVVVVCFFFGGGAVLILLVSYIYSIYILRFTGQIYYTENLSAKYVMHFYPSDDMYFTAYSCHATLTVFLAAEFMLSSG